MRSYLPLFSVEVEHAYFTDGSCPDLDFLPIQRGERVLRNAGLLVRKSANRYAVFFERDRADALQLYASDSLEPLSFGFKVFSQHPSFWNYTELASPKHDQLLHFDSQAAMADQDGRLRLHAREYVSEEDFFPLSSPFFDDLLSQKDRLVKPLLTAMIRLADGRTPLFDHQAKITPKDYYIKFKAREIVWKYYLLGNIARKNAYIVDVNNQTEFVSVGEAMLADRRTAVAFRSTQPLPLRDNAQYRFQLRERGPGAGKVLIQRLPMASAEQFYRETIDGQEVMVSEVYVNY